MSSIGRDALEEAGPIFCEVCGCPNASSAIYCENCGNPLNVPE